jgi:hypothetical protein
MQNSGHLISRSGWACLLDIIQESSQPSEERPVMQLGIKSLELLVSHYLNSLENSAILELLQIIENFKNFSNDNNINYLSCDMLWNIGDFISRSAEGSSDQELVHQTLQKLLSLSLDKHAEARHSAMHIFASLGIYLFINSRGR